MDGIIRIEPALPGRVADVLAASKLMPLADGPAAALRAEGADVPVATARAGIADVPAATARAPVDTIVLAAFEPGRDDLETVIGCAAVEVYGTCGLLRSVAVHPEWRGRHLGQYLVAAAEAEALAAGLRDLYLLTETADSFFAALGYTAIDRTQVPQSVLGSDQFARLCPSSAVAMHRDLTPQD